MIQPNKKEIVSFLKDLRERIISSFEAYEPKCRFKRTPWPYKKGEGGGEISVLRGEVFEKAAVNWSGVSGANFPGTDSGEGFFATGVSLITHMSNPKAPTSHFNIRYIERGEKYWLGGGYDLTPMGFSYEEDTAHFHGVAKSCLDQTSESLYPEFSEAAKSYFTIKHYNCERGVGGIFFDQWNTGDWVSDFGMWKNVGNTFVDAILPILDKRVNEDYSEEDRQTQLKARGRYVEFNLLYDRGTRFGFESGGNPEAILCSMPPLVSW